MVATYNFGSVYSFILKCLQGTATDDMLLLSLSKNGLDTLLAICYQYSCKWRYDVCPNQVFCRQWKMGPNVVNEDINYKH